MALTTQQGQNYYDFEAIQEVAWENAYGIWYAYTPTKDCKLLVNLCDATYTGWREVFDVYSDCSENYIDVRYDYCGAGANATFSANAGQTVYFRILTEGALQGEQGFYFTIEEKDILPGDVCSIPVVAVEGVNVSDNTGGDQWFVYSPSGIGNIVISSVGYTNTDTYVQVFDTCGGQLLADNDGVSNLNQSQLILSTANLPNNIYINWSGSYTNDVYDWSLEFVPEGEMYADFTASNTVAPVNTEIFFTPHSIGYGSMSWDLDGDTLYDSYDINPSYIYTTPGVYSVTHTIYDSLGGDSLVEHKYDYVTIYEESTDPYCQSAQNIAIGTNSFEFVNGLNQWYTYTSDFDGELQVSFCNVADMEVFVNATMTDCDSTMLHDYRLENCPSSDNGYVYTYQVTQGMQLYFNVQTYEYGLMGTQVQFDVQKILPEPGSSCDLPQVLESSSSHSINFSEDNSYADEWYTYTATENKVVEVSSCGNVNVSGGVNFSLFSSCELAEQGMYLDANYRYCIDSSNGETQLYEIQAGETILIHINGQGTQPMIWNFIVRDYYDGEICQKPITAVEGINTMPAFEESHYVYTASQDGLVSISNCIYINVDTISVDFPSGVMVTAECGKDAEIYTYSSGNCGMGAEAVFQVVQGQEYHITWYSYPTNWNLQFVTDTVLPAGVSCDNPLVLSQPQTEVQSYGNIVWFEYSAQHTGNVTFTSDLQYEASVIILTECAPVSENVQSTEPFVMGPSGITLWTQEGVTYKLCLIFHEMAPVEPYTMNYVEESGATIPAHIFCEDAEVISAGTYETTTAYHNYWYQYTAPSDMYLEIADIQEELLNNDVDVQIFDICTHGIDNESLELGMNIPVSCYSEYKENIVRLNAGETVYINLQSMMQSEAFTWALVEHPVSNIGFVDISSGADFLEPIIDNNLHTVELTIVQSASLSSVSLNYKLELGNKLFDEFGNRICEGTQFDFSNGSKDLYVENIDGSITEIWLITVNQAVSYNTASEIVDIYSSDIRSKVVDNSSKSINLTLAWNAPECLYDIQIEVSGGAYVSNNEYANGYVCFPEGSTGLIVRVIAENGSSFTDWTIIYTREQAPAGASCDNPLSAQLGNNSAFYEYEQEALIYEYYAHSTGVLRINTCGKNGIQPIIVEGEVCIAGDESVVILPELCSTGIGYVNEINVVQGQLVYFGLVREDIYTEQSVSFSIEEFEEQLPPVTDITLSTTEENILVGEQVCVDVAVFPQESTSLIKTTISGNTIEKVSDYCYVASYPGTSTVIFESTDGSNITKLLTINSEAAPVVLESISLPSNVALQSGQSIVLEPQFVPANADDKEVVWGSSDSLVASVDAYGKIVATGVGEAYVTAQNISGMIISNQCMVSVSSVVAEGIILNKYSLVLQQGDVYSGISATVLPTNTTNKEVIWESMDASIVEVTENGIVAVNPGNTFVRIELLSNNNIFAQLDVTVELLPVDKSQLIAKVEYVNSLLLNLEDANLIGNNTGQYPQNALDSVIWHRTLAYDVIDDLNATEIMVDIALQNLNDAVLYLENSRIDKIFILSVIIERSERYFNTGESKQIYAYVEPTNATYTELRWEIENSNIASVNSSGIVKANSSGITYVYAYAKDSSEAYDSCKIIVSTPLQSLSLPDNITILENESVTLSPVVNPSGADVNGYMWSTDDESVVTVNTQGVISGIREGIATVSVTEMSSNISVSVVVIVRAQAVSVTGINIQRDSLIVSIGESEKVYPVVAPIDATNKNYSWSSSQSAIAYVNNTGLITGFNLGQSLVKVTAEDGGYIDSVVVTVVPSASPIVEDISHIIVESGTSVIAIPISQYVYDDNTEIADLQFDVVSSDNFMVSIENDSIKILVNNPTFAVFEIFEIKVTDVDNQSAIITISVEVSEVPNAAPEFIYDDVHVKIIDGGVFYPLEFTDYMTDDYTKLEDLTCVVVDSSAHYRTIISGTTMEVSRYDANWIGLDSVQIAVTDEEGLSTVQYFLFEVSQVPNQAPIVSQIPEQLFNPLLGRYFSIDLKLFVMDDYTSSRSIEWITSANARVNISVRNGVATITSADQNWTGSTSVIFTAIDEGGLSDEVTVVFTKTTQTGTTWVDLPKISFSADQTIIAPGNAVSFTSSISGATSWIWHFEGAVPEQSNAPNPTVSYPESGKYKVSLIAMNAEGLDSLVIDEYISVIGINPIGEIACAGSSVSIEATVSAADGYTFEWSTGSTEQSIIVEQSETTTYSLIVRQGLFEYSDEITLMVPDTLVFPIDIELCQGDSYILNVSGFEEYNWNAEGWGTQTSLELTETGTTVVEARDQYGCVSTDDFTITTVHSLPVVDLGDNQEICLGTSTTLDATGANLTYEWSTGEFTPTVTIEDVDGDVSVIVTDENGCANTDTVFITTLRPYEEQIGVVTYGKEGPYVVVAWERTAGQRTQSYEILRETSTLNDYESLGVLPFNNESVFIDDDADARTKSYRYKLVTIDSVCENRAESIPHRSLHIQNNLNTQFKANLTWTAYEGIDFNTYKIYRGTSSGNLEEVDAVTSEATSWTDSQVYQGGWVYRIAMVLPDSVQTDESLLKAESGPYSLAMSNIAEAETSLEDFYQAHIAVFPTIAENFVTVSVGESINEYCVQIVSSQGAVVYNSGIRTASDTQIALDDVARGMYMVYVIVDGVRVLTQIVVY
ncbi:MAG: Ig-like domain-containing protein [Bacteroidales bacterium]|nr:Ig-like domain-containing protein [Bacteroidales bacterium]